MKKLKVLIPILIPILLLAAAYLGGALFFLSHYLPRTSINGVDVGMMDLEGANEKISMGPVDVTLIEKNSSGTSTIMEKIELGRDIPANLTYDTHELLEDQEIFAWPKNLFTDTELTSKRVYGDYDEGDLVNYLLRLYCMNENNIVEPTPAHLEVENGSVVIKEANDGSMIDQADLEKEVVAFVKAFVNGSGKDTLDLTPFYLTADKTDNRAWLEQQRDTLQAVLDKTVSIVVSDSITVTIEKEGVRQLLTLYNDELVVDEETLGTFVNELCDKYDVSSTYYINRDSLRSSLRNSLRAANSTTVYAAWISSSPKPSTSSSDTYIDVDYSEQTLRFYKDGALVLTSDIVTGNAATYTIIDYGTYYVQKKKQGATLKGSDYTQYVDYWIGFGRSGHYSNGGGILGFHDASWRSSFGGDIWLYDPSHGCVNMPLDKVEQLYNSADIGTEIHIHE